MNRTLISARNHTDNTRTIKFLYSYGGKILPRSTDGKLRYVGGLTRVLAVDRSISFKELMVRFEELGGSLMRLKCKLPTEDLDVLVSITCDEDLANLIDEYDRFSLASQKDVKITAILFPIKTVKKMSPVTSVNDMCSTGSSGECSAITYSPPYSIAGSNSVRAYGRNYSPSLGVPGIVQKHGGEVRCRPCCEQRSIPRHLYRCFEHGRPRQNRVTHWNRCQ